MQSLIYIGCGALALGAWLISRGIRRGIRRGVLEAEGYLLLLRRLRTQMGCYLKAPSDALLGFECAPLSDIGLLPLVDGDVQCAFRRTRGRCHISKAILELLDECFSELGSGYIDVELRRIDDCIERLESLIDVERREGEKRGKVITVLMCAVAMLVVIVTI